MTKRNWLGITAIMLVVALIVGGLGFLSKGFKDWNWFDKDTDTEDVLNVLESNGIKLSFSLTSGGGENENIRRITATILPENATNKNVDWSIEWVNPSSTWATGEVVTDYATITPISEGALVADLECLQAFGEQVKVSVTSRANSEKFATCTFDYAKRLTNTDPLISCIHNGTSVYFSQTYSKHSVNIIFEYGVGTLSDTFEISSSVSLTDDFYSHLISACNSCGIDTSLVKNNSIVLAICGANVFVPFDPYELLGSITEMSIDTDTSLQFFQEVLNYSGYIFDYEVICEGQYSTFTQSLLCKVGGVDLWTGVDSVSADVDSGNVF